MDLHHTISTVLTGVPTPATVRQLVETFHRIAVVYLRTKAHAGSLNPELFGLSIEDLAFDCIADLFRRNDEGRFVRLDEYFKETDVAKTTDAELLSLSRRLVFSKVNQDLYRQYREFDRPLHNIIRALKSASVTTPGLSLDCEQDEWWISFGKDNRNATSNVLMPPEFLEIHLASFAASRPRLRDLLVKTSELFHDQTLYRRAFPLFWFGRILRSAYSHTDASTDVVIEEHHCLSCEDIRKHILASTAEVQKAMRPAYVDKGKIGVQVFDVYFKTIPFILESDYLSDDGVELSYYDHLQPHMGSITQEQYQQQHRAYVEYLTKLTRQNFLEAIRKEL